MKTINNLLAISAIALCVSCGQQKTENTATAQQPAQPSLEKQKCEVEEKGQSLINKLMVSIEDMTSAKDKLHEVLEKHNHKEISERAKQIEEAMLALMKQSEILPSVNFKTLSHMTKSVLEIATEFTWHNNFHGTDENTTTFETLESSIAQLKAAIKKMNDVPENICLTKKEVAKNEMQTHLALMGIYSGQIDRAHDNNSTTYITYYCGRLEELVKSFRENIANLDSKDFTTLNRTLADVEHEAHEMREQAEQGHYGELHHALETINKSISRLTEEAGETS